VSPLPLPAPTVAMCPRRDIAAMPVAMLRAGTVERRYLWRDQSMKLDCEEAESRCRSRC